MSTSSPGTAMSSSSSGPFFRSRWVEQPAGVRELSPTELPAGFQAAGVACGIKSSGERDVGLLVCDADDAVSAARFTRNSLVAAPVIVSQRRQRSRLRAVVVNSGNANVSTGEQGLEVAETMSATAADGLGVPHERVAVASTGIIGQGLDRDPVMRGVAAALRALGSNADDFAHAILTTDRGPKHASLELALSGGAVRLCAQAKGAGMISPSFATMLCFIETDAGVDSQTLERLLDAAVERSFERISVDGQLSTNDSLFMIASGASGVDVTPGSDDEQIFADALDALLRQLAIEIVADGEGATRVARLEVHGGPGAAEPVARSVANSPLVKCALFGGDPNWGRMLAAAGQALPNVGEVEFDLSIEGVEVARSSVASPLTEAEARRIDEAMKQPEVEMSLYFAACDEVTEVFFSDLGPDYVALNAAYST
jgi:glutamate N-acetyltransferase / amino-acid N-acetyltransferase